MSCGDGPRTKRLRRAARRAQRLPEIAVCLAVQTVLQGRRRMLLTLCTGAGKTAVAFPFQICWKLWSARWNNKQTNRRPKILFLSDRNVLVDDPMAKDFRPFGDARHKITAGRARWLAPLPHLRSRLEYSDRRFSLLLLPDPGRTLKTRRCFPRRCGSQPYARLEKTGCYRSPGSTLTDNAGSTACRGRCVKWRLYVKVRGRMWRLCCRRCCTKRLTPIMPERTLAATWRLCPKSATRTAPTPIALSMCMPGQLRKAWEA